MNNKKQITKNIYHLFLVLLLIFIPTSTVIKAQVMQSTGYKIQSDSINFGGTENSSSTNYGLSDSLGEVGTGPSSSGSYTLQAGYRQIQEGYISLSAPSDISLASISGLAGGTSEDAITWTVITDSPAGYEMSVQSQTSPALQAAGIDSFADYTPATSDPDYNFSILSTASAFGFSPEGTDIVSRYKDNGGACNTGSGETQAKCWDGFSLTPKTIASKNSGNQPLGSAVSVRVRAQAGTDRMQSAGTYQATITVTATAL